MGRIDDRSRTGLAKADASIPDSLGALGECVMSIYGVVRLLQSRDLGPAQLLPAVNSISSEARDNSRSFPAMYAQLRRETDMPELRSALDALERRVGATTEQLIEAFGRHKLGKLGARARLELEREAERLGVELQALRALTEVADAAIHPRPATVTLGELARGRWQTRPTFVSREVELCIAGADVHSIEGDPRVLWALLLRQIQCVVEAGVERPCAQITPCDDGTAGFLVSVGDVVGLELVTMERAVVQLAPSVDIADGLLDAVAELAGIEVRSTGNRQLVSIAVAAA